MAETPTREQVLIIRPDLEEYINGNGFNLDIDDYTAKALAQVKRDIEDTKDIKWSMVYDSDNAIYLTNSDGEAKNDDRLKNAIILLAVSLVFKDYSIKVNDSSWWDLSLSYRADYDRAVTEMKLDVDWDESGDISTGEDRNTTQTFLGR